MHALEKLAKASSSKALECKETVITERHIHLVEKVNQLRGVICGLWTCQLHPPLVLRASRLFFLAGGRGGKKKTSGNYSQVSVCLSQKVGTDLVS